MYHFRSTGETKAGMAKSSAYPSAPEDPSSRHQGTVAPRRWSPDSLPEIEQAALPSPRLLLLPDNNSISATKPFGTGQAGLGWAKLGWAAVEWDAALACDSLRALFSLVSLKPT